MNWQKGVQWKKIFAHSTIINPYLICKIRFTQMIKLNLIPKTIFLIDGLGATLSAFLMIAVLKPFNEFVGMPRELLTLLSIGALILATYSFSCFVFLRNKVQKLLKPLITANLSYCIVTLALVIYFYDNLTILGLIYFLAEISLVFGLVYIELGTLKASRTNA